MYALSHENLCSIAFPSATLFQKCYKRFAFFCHKVLSRRPLCLPPCQIPCHQTYSSVTSGNYDILHFHSLCSKARSVGWRWSSEVKCILSTPEALGLNSQLHKTRPRNKQTQTRTGKCRIYHLSV